MAIAHMKWSTWIPGVDGGEPNLKPGLSDLKDPRWPMPAQSIVRAWQDDDDHVIDVELRLDADDRPVVTGIVVRRASPLSAMRKHGPEWPEGTEPQRVRPRDVKRLPLSEVARAAVAWVEATKEEPGSAKRDQAMDKAHRAAFRPPRGRPVRGKADSFYKSLAEVHRSMVGSNVKSPAKVLATQMGEDPSKVHVWLHRARQRGFRTG